jgi:rhodanese-related sulfurtransferase
MTQIIIDTREDFEYAESHVAGAINIPPAQFMTGEVPVELRDIAKDMLIVVYCRSGSRSNVVGHILKQHGFTNVVNGTNQGKVEQMLAK